MWTLRYSMLKLTGHQAKVESKKLEEVIEVDVQREGGAASYTAPKGKNKKSTGRKKYPGKKRPPTAPLTVAPIQDTLFIVTRSLDDQQCKDKHFTMKVSRRHRLFSSGVAIPNSQAQYRVAKPYPGPHQLEASGGVGGAGQTGVVRVHHPHPACASTVTVLCFTLPLKAPPLRLLSRSCCRSCWRVLGMLKLTSGSGAACLESRSAFS
ncbi:hypothetical protein E2C01_028196 [Portunus trituberculatus]|uniref:Uncharacterized protein n=1 Tax=Portunus trituberculatus TaxID=210409 RepID=A0A5B7EMZ9_PORTR|nr:hypothetical protein [Portunus trituberculatus]